MPFRQNVTFNLKSEYLPCFLIYWQTVFAAWQYNDIALKKIWIYQLLRRLDHVLNWPQSEATEVTKTRISRKVGNFVYCFPNYTFFDGYLFTLGSNLHMIESFDRCCIYTFFIVGWWNIQMPKTVHRYLNYWGRYYFINWM